MPRQSRLSNEELVEGLRIDEDDLDSCLVNQADLFYQVATAANDAAGERDTLELELKELKAQLDTDVRARLVEEGAKFTETSLMNQIMVLSRVKELQRRCLTARRKADNSQSLKESYQQRSYALRELNASQLARFYNLGTERGADSARRNRGDEVRRQAEAKRAAQRGTERYRPRDQGD